MSSKFEKSVYVPETKYLEDQKTWILDQIKEIGPERIEELARLATEARTVSYAPYSNYHVGAAVLTTALETHIGANIERVSYSESIHAEETAVAAAVLGGAVNKQGRRFIKAVAVSHPGDSGPCSHCRQILGEHCDNCLIIVADTEGEVKKITSLQLLMLDAFTPSDLGIE